MSESDLVLFERWRQGRDAEAFAELVSRYADMVYATCRRVTGDAVAAEDVTQECFLKLAEGRAKVHRSVAGWLHSLATCRSLDRLRGEARRRRLEERFAGEVREPVTIAWEDLQPHIDAAIEDLPERLREVVVRHFLHGETHAEVAARLGVSRPAVSKSVARGVERIRVFLRRRGIAVSAVVLAGLVADGVVEAAPESVRISLGKLALSGVPDIVPLIIKASAPWVAKLAAAFGGFILIISASAALYTWSGQAPSSWVKRAATAASAHPPLPQPDIPVTTPATPEVATEVTSVPSTNGAKEVSTAAISGKVYGEDALPLAGAKIEVSGIEKIPGLVRKTVAVQTKEDGTYEVEGIETEGTSAISVRAAAPGYVDKVEGIELSARSVQDNMDFELRTGVALLGQVVTASGTPVPGAMVMPWNDRAMWDKGRIIGRIGDYAIPCDQDGRFELGIDLISHPERVLQALDIVAPGFGARHFSKVTFPEGEPMLFHLEESSSVKGRVRWQDGSPAVGYAVRAYGTVADAQEEIDMSAARGCAVNEDGTFEIPGLPPRLKYDLCVHRIDGPTVPNPRVQTPPIEPGGIFEWNPVLAPLTRVTGSIHVPGTAETLVRYSARAVKEGPPHPIIRDENMDGGDYELLFSSPGIYWVYPIYDQSDYSDMDTLKAYGKRVELKAGDDVRVDLSVPRPYIFPVRVLDSQGAPLTDAELQLCWLGSMGGEIYKCAMERKLDADGRFTWFCKAGNEVWFTARAKGYHPEETLHRVAQANISVPEETIVLYPSAGFRANVVLSDGVEIRRGICLRVIYPDGLTEDMNKTVIFSGRSTLYWITSGIRSGPVSIVAFEADVDEPHMSQTVECTVAPGEIYDLGDLVMR